MLVDMSFYIRAFCTQGEPPPLRPVLSFSAERGTLLALDPEVSRPVLDDGSWEQVGLVYKDNKASILFEVNRDDGDVGSLMREEIEEFMEHLADAPNNRNRRRVEKHLQNTRFIVAARLPTFDIDEDGYTALGHVLNYLLRNNGAMIQADGEGFYAGEKVIVELE